jgi:hypothetical protein
MEEDLKISSEAEYACTPVFPEGTNADTHYRVKSYKCSEPCDCPVKERPPIRPKGMSYGNVYIQDGVYVQSEQIPTDQERRGFVRYSSDYVPEILPKFYPRSSELKTFTVDLAYRDYKYVYRQGKRAATNLSIEYDKQIRRITAEKNSISQVKSFIAQYAGCDEAHKFRKRAIALSKIHNSISDEVFRFGIEEP